jgi:hypothetical protein
MNPKEGDFVKVLFANGLVEEGFVIQWTDNKSALKNKNGKSTLIIQRTLEDIRAVQIIHDSSPDIVEEVKPESVFADQELKPDKYYKREDLRAMKLAELRIEAANLERERVKKALTTFSPTGSTNGTPYELGRTTLPGKLQSIPQYSKKKTTVHNR